MVGEGATDRAGQGYEDTRRSSFEEKEARVSREQTVVTFVDVRHGKVQGIRQLVPDQKVVRVGRKGPLNRGLHTHWPRDVGSQLAGRPLMMQANGQQDINRQKGRQTC